MAKKDDTYNEETAKLLIQRWINGESLNTLFKDPTMPPATTWYRWATNHPWISAAMAQAREIRADQAADEVMTVADTEPDPQRARVKVEARKWYAGVMNRQRYGNQVDVNVTNQIDVKGALNQARQRLPRPMRDQFHDDNPQVIDLYPQLTDQPNDYESSDQADSDQADDFDDLL